jgi:uncharacterized protein
MGSGSECEPGAAAASWPGAGQRAARASRPDRPTQAPEERTDIRVPSPAPHGNPFEDPANVRLPTRGPWRESPVGKATHGALGRLCGWNPGRFRGPAGGRQRGRSQSGSARDEGGVAQHRVRSGEFVRCGLRGPAGDRGLLVGRGGAGDAGPPGAKGSDPVVTGRPAGDRARTVAAQVRRGLWVAGWPARLALLLLVRLYRVTLGQIVGGGCRFYPSCSAYAEQAIADRGVLRGAALAAWRILRCSPLSNGGVDYPPGSRLYDRNIHTGARDAAGPGRERIRG